MATPGIDLITSRARLRIAEREPGVVDDDDIIDFIDAAQNDLVWKLPYQALWFLTEGTEIPLELGVDSYTFSGLDIDFVYEVAVTYQGHNARRWEIERLAINKAIPLLSPSEDKPFYTIWNNGIIFFVGASGPSGTGVAKVFFVRAPAIPDDLEFPEQYWVAIETYVVARCWESMLNFAERDKSMAEYKELITDIRGKYVEGRNIDKQ